MKYTLSKNQMYKKEGDPKYVARPRVASRMTKQQVIEALSHATTLTEADISGVLAGLEKILVQFVILGHSIDLGFIALRYSIKGGFDSLDDTFQKDRHRLKVNTAIAKTFEDSVNQALNPVKVDAEGNEPKLKEIFKESGDLALVDLQPGNLIRITGKKMAFDKADTETGVYLNPEFGAAIRVDEYVKNIDTVIPLKIPNNVANGKYYLEVRTRANNGSILRGFLKDPITIAA